jgi:hypothetical protein
MLNAVAKFFASQFVAKLVILPPCDVCVLGCFFVVGLKFLFVEVNFGNIW